MTGFALTRRQTLAASSALVISACGPRQRGEPGLLRVALSGEPDSLDPLKGQFATSALLYYQLHAPLTDYSPSGGLAPGLADSWRSEDGSVWDFHLNPDLKWSDGAPLTAEDVVWTTRRAVDPTTGFADLGDFFAVTGAREALRGDRHPDEIGVEMIDPTTVRFHFDQPIGLFPVFMREFYPLPRHVVESVGDDWVKAEHWVSAGAYTLKEDGALTYLLERNPHFYGAATVQIPQIRADVVEDASTRARMFRAGDLDLVNQPPPEQIGFLREELGERLRGFRAPILTYLKVNQRQPGLSDVRVRKALSLAIDRHFLTNQFFQAEGTPTDFVIPAEDAALADLQTAQSLLAEAGYGPDNPLQVTLRTTSGGRERIAIAIADDWANLGVDVSLLATYPVDMFQAVDAGEFDVALARFNRGLKTDPNFMIEPFGPDGFADDGGWTGPERDQFNIVMGQAKAELDAEQRTTLYRQAETLLLDQQVVIPLVHERAYWMVSNNVSGLREDIQPMQWRDLAVR